MALFVVLSDFSGPSTISAGSILDSDAYDLPSLQASGLAVLPYTSAMDPTIAAYLAQRGSAPSQAAQGDLTASLASAGFVGGGITTLTGFSPIATTVAGSSATVGLVPGSPGDVLTWSGAAWAGAALPAAVSSVLASAPISSSGGTAPTISISAATTLAAGSMSAADKTKLDAISTVVSSVGATAPLATTGGTTPTISISGSGASAGNVLAWNGTAWAPAAPAAPAVPIMVSIDTATPTTVSYETRGAVYLPASRTIAAACAAYFYQGGSNNTGFLRLTDANTTTTFAEFVTSASFSPRYIAASVSAGYVGTTLAAGWYVVQVKYSSGGSSFLNGLGLYIV